MSEYKNNIKIIVFDKSIYRNWRCGNHQKIYLIEIMEITCLARLSHDVSNNSIALDKAVRTNEKEGAKAEAAITFSLIEAYMNMAWERGLL